MNLQESHHANQLLFEKGNRLIWIAFLFLYATGALRLPSIMHRIDPFGHQGGHNRAFLNFENAEIYAVSALRQPIKHAWSSSSRK